MNKFTLMLQDKEVIKELARDPEIQVKIKNSIVDEVKRRLSKGIDKKISEEMKEYRASISSRLKEVDISQIIREEAAKIVERKFR